MAEQEWRGAILGAFRTLRDEFPSFQPWPLMAGPQTITWVGLSDQRHAADNDND